MLQEILEQLYKRYKETGEKQIWVHPKQYFGIIILPGKLEPMDLCDEAFLQIPINQFKIYPRCNEPDYFPIKGEVIEAAKRGEISIGYLVNYDAIVPEAHKRLKELGCEIKKEEEDIDKTDEELLEYYLQEEDEEKLSIPYICNGLELELILVTLADKVILGKTPTEAAEYILQKAKELQEL